MRPRRGLRPARGAILLAAAALAVLPGRVALAHGGPPPAPEDALAAWTWTPGLLIALGALTMAYITGVIMAWDRAGVGRGVRRGQFAAFGGAVLALSAALFSPIDPVSDALFSMHMVQHLLLIFVAAPLLVAANIPVALLWALPRKTARGLGRWWGRRRRLNALGHTLTQPAVAWIAYVGLLWFWHIPGPYDAAVRNDLVHDLEHVAFLGTGLLFWWALLSMLRQREPAYGAAVVYVFAALLQANALGALLTLTERPLYTSYGDTTAAWGLTQAEDQQLGGVIMWVPGHLIFLVLTISMLYIWLSRAAPSNEIRSADEPRR